MKLIVNKMNGQFNVSTYHVAQSKSVIRLHFGFGIPMQKSGKVHTWAMTMCVGFD
jgi:hypothetical protein